MLLVTQNVGDGEGNDDVAWMSGVRAYAMVIIIAGANHGRI